MFVSPMLLHKSEQPFNDENFITELKLDGIRLILSKFEGKVRLYTRHSNEVTSKFHELSDIDIPDGTVLDGELVVSDSEGKPDFEAMMERFMSIKLKHKIQYCVFDVIYFSGKKVTNLSLVEQKDLLASFLEPSEHITLVQWMHGNAEAYFKLVKQHELEGVVLKRASSKYQINKRSQDWLKVINYQYAETYITGLRKDEFGLLLSVQEGDKLRPVGIMEFIGQEAKKRFYGQYKAFIVDENEKYIYLDPQIKCSVKFRNYTKAGNLRIPSFVKYT